MITQLSSSAPNDSMTCLDSICDISDAVTVGDEEIMMSTNIQSAFHALFSHCSSAFVEVRSRIVGTFAVWAESAHHFFTLHVANFCTPKQFWKGNNCLILSQEDIFARPIRTKYSVNTFKRG